MLAALPDVTYINNYNHRENKRNNIDHGFDDHSRFSFRSNNY